VAKTKIAVLIFTVLSLKGQYMPWRAALESLARYLGGDPLRLPGDVPGNKRVA
jgi:hypothetical protein